MPTAWLKLSALLMCAGCALGPEGDRWILWGVVRGTVATAAGTPVADARVVVTAQYEVSPGSTIPLTASARTDADGHYLVTLQLANQDDATVPAVARVDATSAHPGGESGPLLVPLRTSFARDTAVGDVILPP
jgi:hypothetical protein